METVEGGGLKAVPLAGYPTLVGPQPPQKAVMWQKHLFVAGGLNGTVIDIGIGPTGLGRPRATLLPPASLVLADGSSGTDASAETGNPFVSLVAMDGRGDLLAIVNPHHVDTSVAYILDPVAMAVVGRRQLPFGASVAVSGDSSSFWVATSQGHLLQLLTPRMDIAHDWRVPKALSGLDIADGKAVVSVGAARPDLPGGNAALLSVDLSTGESHSLASATTPFAGPVVVQGSGVWWVLPELGAIRWVPNQGSMRDYSACRSISALAAKSGTLLATCVGTHQLAIISLRDGATERVPAGAFPDAVVFGP
ncbi:MAG TPA: hypothetical protein VN193_09325 [Candidatus Angelobacter sp.]|nr:hypothetical protein [Candidatus Angelobacter sp.]